MIVSPDAIVDPPAVDLHLEHASVALTTVVRSLWLEREVTLYARLIVIFFCWGAFWDEAWIRKACSEPADKSHECRSSESDEKFGACR